MNMFDWIPNRLRKRRQREKPKTFDRLPPDTILEFSATCRKCGTTHYVQCAKHNYNHDEMQEILARHDPCLRCREDGG